jgi:DNA primase
VKTPFGYHPIEAVTEDHPVVSGQGAYQRVLATHARNYDGELVEIVTRKIRRPVMMTADHKVFAIRPTARSEVRFKVFAQRFRGYLRRYKRDPGYYFRKIAKWLPIQEIEAGNLRVGDMLLYPLNDRVTSVERVDLEQYVVKRSTRGKQPSRLPIVTVNADFLRLIGYFIAEGSTNRADIRFSLGTHEEMFANEIVQLVDSLFGLRAAIHRRVDKSGLEITACHAVLANAFENLCGHGAQRKHIPFVLQDLPIPQKRILIEAIAKGDGTLFVADRSSHTSRSITTISQVLAEQLVDCLLALGYFPHLSVVKRHIRQGVRHREAYMIVWPEEARPRYDLVYRTEGGKRYWLLPIERLGRSRYRGPVYNLTVENDHSYIVSHVTVANCGNGGDIFDFVMRISNLSFGEAVETLAHRAGVQLERSPEEVRQASERDRLYRSLEAAAGFFREQLMHQETGRLAREYLTRRGVDEATTERFRLGYATPNWDDLLRALGAKGFSPPLLSSGGLVQPRATGDGYYDMFRHRLIFPIQDLQDRPVAFGGRALDETPPKYLNSRETAVFIKGRMLYALNWAREAIRQRDEVVVVEGNMDVLTCHQFGITNAVASLGTSLTPDQVLVLKRFAGKAVLVYDADAAGQAAMERAMTLFEEADLPVRVVVLPSGDPDAYLRAEGVEKFRALLADAVPIFDYQVGMAASRHDPKRIEGKVRIVDELLPAVAAVANPVRQAEYIRSLAQRFELAEDAVRQRLRARQRGKGQPGSTPEVILTPDRARHQAERLLVHLMVREPGLRRRVGEALAADDFQDPRYRGLVQALHEGPDEDIDALRDRVADEALQRLLLQMIFEDPPVMEKEKERVVKEAIDYLVHREPAAQQRLALAKQIQQAQASGDLEQVRRLQMQYVKLIGPTLPKVSSSLGSAQGGPSGKGGEEDGQEEGGA